MGKSYHEPLGSRDQKGGVNYRLSEKCATCVFFAHPNACKKVSGTISPEAVCDLWAIRENQKPYNKRFFSEQAGKAGRTNGNGPFGRVKFEGA